MQFFSMPTKCKSSFLKHSDNKINKISSDMKHDIKRFLKTQLILKQKTKQKITLK